MNKKRRGNNEGTIYEEAGKWVAQLNLGHEMRNGKRRRIRRKFVAKTRREVQRKLTEALHKQDNGEPIERGRIQFGTLMRRWLDEVACRELQASTLVAYESLIKNHIDPSLGRAVVTELQPDMIDRFLAEKQSQGLSPRSVQFCHAIIRRALRQGIKWRMIAYNAASAATPPRSAPKPVSPFTPEQARLFFSACQNESLGAFFTVALALGLRRGEALGLTWPDIDFDQKKLTVRQTLQRIGGKLIIGATKTKKSSRTISLPDLVIEALTRQREQQQDDRLFAGKDWVESGLIFTTKKGTPIEPRNALRSFHRLLKVIGLPQHRLHDLRHTAASLWLDEGAELHEMEETLGHSQIQLTSNLSSRMLRLRETPTANRLE